MVWMMVCDDCEIPDKEVSEKFYTVHCSTTDVRWNLCSVCFKKRMGGLPGVVEDDQIKKEG
jgi:hypothetical protein